RRIGADVRQRIEERLYLRRGIVAGMGLRLSQDPIDAVDEAGFERVRPAAGILQAADRSVERVSEGCDRVRGIVRAREARSQESGDDGDEDGDSPHCVKYSLLGD